MKKIVIILFVLFSKSFYAQSDDLSVFVRTGRASDNDAMGSFGGGAPSYQFWDPGPIYNFGVETSLNKSFSLQGIINISIHKYDGSRTYGEKTNDAYNRIFDLMGIIKWKLGWFHISGGIGFSHQNGDAIKYLEATEYHSVSVRIREKTKTLIAGSFGLGFDIHIYDKFSLLAEGDLFFREYLGSAWLLGIKYCVSGM